MNLFNGGGLDGDGFGVDDHATICALSTPPGVGGIAVLRVSGPDAFQFTRKVCRFLPVQPESHRIYFGTARCLDDGDSVDEVLVSCFAEGRSFTGEETAEISCHGNPVLVATLLKLLVEAGCRPARPGEFTFRSFMNGRMDLVQAEGVLSLIESQSRPAARLALRQLKGRLSEELSRVEDGLIWILAQLEASIDFSTEGIEVIPSQTLLARAREVQEACERLLESYSQGRLLAEGVQVALVGRPNVGKSSLLNAIVQEDRAIVTAVPGTTRDLVEGRFAVNGVPVTIIDTAGLRETTDEVERIGISRTRQALDKSDLVFHVIEVGRPLQEDEREDLRDFRSNADLSERARHVFLVNKVDSPDQQEQVAMRLAELNDIGISKQNSKVFEVSARTRNGLSELENFLKGYVRSDASESSSVLTQARHFEGVQKIHSCLMRALALITSDTSAEFIAFELQDAIRAIHELLGKELNEQVIDRIFKEFCLGK
ncbi:MAG: tRNA uridine-5-carboxymethylaminomethyl(34) synthesis GTPase MnmE [Bdellovibrionaceae bacterium]|nr:tRNA uridine-5-carboxymethylaminomethyl(34) synthesis GTPase MnmE [Pseudobdellovibrionaceae bacterium]